MNTIVILTALFLEQEAVVNSYLSNLHAEEHPETKTQYKVGSYISKGTEIQVIVGRTNQTNVNAGIETERIINLYKPSHIFFVGVAGGLKDVKIGDLVIGADVYGFERGKAEEIFKPRPKFGFSSYELEMKALDFSATSTWLSTTSSIIQPEFAEKISVYSGTIASGEKVDASLESDLHKFLKIHCSHALAVEMEGLGFLEACRHYPHIKSLLLRGISDLVEEKETADKKGSQPYASQNVSAFLFGLIDYLDIGYYVASSSRKDILFEIATKLYPGGIRDNGIWERAGGDLSQVHLFSTGKAQWIEALRLIEHGGGGDIDFDTLIKQMKIDNPRNVSLKTIN
ncbi:MAG: adenosylhomocysteine nucleosidase [Acidobacteriota bacterium]|nr:adenosylhomocysteine nucleosidase [Acidobacteriota bacterium]